MLCRVRSALLLSPSHTFACYFATIRDKCQIILQTECTPAGLTVPSSIPTMTDTGAKLVISLDFELHWGVRDHLRVEQYRENLLGVRQAIPAMLDLFQRYEVHATWATVGMLFAETKKQLEAHIPSRIPGYTDNSLSPYLALHEVGTDEASDPFHFAPSLIRQIAASPHQELATHTFSHYYPLEAGQTAEDFEHDLRAAAAIAAPFGDVCQSIVFPRNQLNPAYLDVLDRCGVRAMRGNGTHWAYAPLPYHQENPARRAARLLDAYLPLVPTTRHIRRETQGPVDVSASIFFRPYKERFRAGDSLRIQRINRAMTHAADTGGMLHLWWHPHNFGTHLRENLALLTQVLDHFAKLRRTHAMQSLSMREAS